jgi:localization factor PodJL
MAMTMQPDLPWNVAGIAPEAREAARTSARREGLSVGEWLTRRILKGVADMETSPDEWWLREPHCVPAAETAGRGTDEQIDEDANLARIESGNEGRHRRVEEPINGALSQIAAQVRLATHQRRESFEELGARMAELDSRLSKIERNAVSTDIREKEALQALQARIAGLANQISKTAARGLAQNTELAKTIEAVAGKFSQSRSEADAQRNALDERVCAIAENVAVISGKLDESREDNERQISGAEERLAAIELAVETMGRDGNATARLDESLDRLTRRLETTEAEYLNNIERMETRLTRVEANSGETVLDDRLHGIEQTLAEMAKLLEKNADEKTDAGEAISSELREPGGGPGRDDQELPAASVAGAPILDLPPFPEKATLANPEGGPITRPPAQDLRATLQDIGKARVHGAEPPIADVDSFLAAARRTAANSTQPRNAPFSWVDPPGAYQATESSKTRLVLVGALGLLVVAAVGAGLYLSNMPPGAPAFSHIRKSVLRPVKVTAAPQRLAKYIPATPTASRPAAKNARDRDAAVSRAVGSTVMADQHTAPARSNPSVPVSLSTTTTSKPLAPQQRLVALASAGNSKAQEVLGLEYVDGDDVTMNEAEGAKWLERAAARGEAVAAYRLGTLYERGHGVAVDQAKAAQWYTVAAKAGNRKAMHNLAVAYAQATGVQKDPSLAAQWFLRAANLGLADSQFNVAVLYERGLGVPQSLKEAYKWYTIAAAQGDAESRNRIQAITPQLRPDDKAAADKAAAAFHPAPLDRTANAPPIVASLIGG